MIVEVHGHAAHIHGAHRHAPHVAMVHGRHVARCGRAAMPSPMPGAVPGTVSAGDLLQHLFRCLEGEIVQEEHHLLPVGRKVFRLAHDERRGQQLHFLQRHMAVHPVGAGHRREVVAARFTGRKQRQRHIGHAVLLVRRNLPMPMDDGGNGKIIGKVDPESLARIEDEALSAWAGKAEDGRRSPVDVERAAGGKKPKRRGLLGPGPDGKLGCSQHGCAGGQEAASGIGSHSVTSGRRVPFEYPMMTANLPPPAQRTCAMGGR